MTTATGTNARFWTIIHNSPVKLTLRPGQSVTHIEQGATDEGYRYSGCTWSLGDGIVQCAWGSRETDCDGRHENSGETYAPIYALRRGSEDSVSPGVVYPAWERGEHWQRDHAAESAGY